MSYIPTKYIIFFVPIITSFIYFTYNSVNTTIKYYRFVYSYMFRLD